MSTTISNVLLNSLRTYAKNMIAYARYMVGGTWYRSELNSAEVAENGAVQVTFYIEPKSGISIPATRFQLCNASGTVLVSRTETVSFTEYVDKILIRFKVGIIIGDNNA